MKCKVKDAGFGGLSKLVWRAKLGKKRVVLDPASPSEAGQHVNPSLTGKAGRDRNNVVQGWIFCHNKAETEKTASNILFPWHVQTIISNNITGAWFDPPTIPPPPPLPLRVWLGGEASVR